MTLASSNADGLRLLHCGPGVADTVIYGPSDNGIADNPDELLDDNEDIATSAAPKPKEGQAIARYLDGQDSNQSGIDFTLQMKIHLVVQTQRLFVERAIFRLRSMRFYPILMVQIVDKSG